MTTLPNRSTVVSNIDFLNLHTFFDAMTLMYRVTTRLAAQFHTPADMAAIRAQQAAFAAAVEAQDALAMIATNREFHAVIARAGRNPYYESLCLRLLDEAAACSGCIIPPLRIVCRISMCRNMMT